MAAGPTEARKIRGGGGRGGQAGPEGEAKGREREGGRGQEGVRRKKGSLRGWLPGPGPTQVLSGPWSPGQPQTLPRPGGKTLHAGLGIWGLWVPV